MFDDELNKYKRKGNFTFKSIESLKDKCDAPPDQSGVYLIYKIVNGREILIYIGSSGQRNKNGMLKTRKGGMKDRLINGYHPNKFGQTKRIKRHKSFPQQMRIEKIKELRFYWWVTYDNENLDFPTDVEKILIDKYLNKHKRHPDWHKN